MSISSRLRDMGHYFIAGSDVTPISPLDVGFAGNDGENGKPTSDVIFGFHCTKQHAFHHFFSNFTFNVWLGFAYVGGKCGGLGVKIGENISGFQTQPNQFFLLGP